MLQPNHTPKKKITAPLINKIIIQFADRLIFSCIFRAKTNEPIASKTITPNTISTNQTGPSPLALPKVNLPVAAPVPGAEFELALAVGVTPAFVLALSDGVGVGVEATLAVETGELVGAVAVGWAVARGDAVAAALGLVCGSCADAGKMMTTNSESANNQRDAVMTVLRMAIR